MSNELRERWGVAGLQQRLQALEPGLLADVVTSVGSTNSALLDQFASIRPRLEARDGSAGLPAQLLVAEQQTQGRGRQGRAWLATPGASLTFSLALILTPRDWSGLSLAVGVALADALDPTGPQQAGAAGSNSPRIALKWPNDLWLRDETASGGGRKLGGVLIETASCQRQGTRVCVIGVGLNIRPQTLEGVSSGVACLQELQPGTMAPAVLTQVAGPLLASVRRFEREGFAGIVDRFAPRDLLKGHTVTTTLPGLTEGRAVGVDGTGALLVQSPDGRQHVVVGGEVSVRPLHGRAA